jgi:hypothetical protein
MRPRGLVQVSFPLHLAPEFADRGLRVCFDEQSQTGFHHCLLGAGAAATHGLAHQSIIDFDIGPRDAPRCVRTSYLCVSPQVRSCEKR